MSAYFQQNFSQFHFSVYSHTLDPDVQRLLNRTASFFETATAPQTAGGSDFKPQTKPQKSVSKMSFLSNFAKKFYSSNTKYLFSKQNV